MTREEIVERMGWLRSADNVMSDIIVRIEKIVNAAIAAEREACASILDQNVAVCGTNSAMRDVLAGNALAIRARGEQE